MGSHARRVVRLALFCLAPLALAAQVPSKPVLTVLDFKVDGVSEKEMTSVISLLSSALFESGAFTVIDVTQRDLLLEEQAFSAADCTDESCQLRIGKLLAAERIVVGNLGKLGSRYMISAKMLDTETGSTVAVADGIYANMDGLVDGLRPLAAKLAGVPAPAGPAAARAARGPAWRKAGAYASVVAGLGAGGAAAWLLYDGIANGRTSIELAQAAYDSATAAADAQAAWEALTATVTWTKTEIGIGIGLASGGLLLGGLATYLFLTQAPADGAVSIRLSPAREGVLLSLTVRR